MSEDSKQKKPHGWFFKNFIFGIVFSYAVWVALLIFAFNKNDSVVNNLLSSIIPGILGTFGYVLVKFFSDWFYSHFIVFTRNALTFLLFRYIVWPAVGCFLFPALILELTPLSKYIPF